MLLAGSPPDDQNDDMLGSDSNADGSWDIGNSSGHANVPSGGSSKPMTEEEQKISVALQVIFNQKLNPFVK
jgi:hypothetical protein